jgi:uncharacterized protein (TIGR03435 family)
MAKPTVILLMYLMTFSAEKLAFEAASVKQNTSGQRGYALPPPIGDRFIATNVSLKMLVSYAYHLQDIQLVGATGWMNSELFDIEAKSPMTVPEDKVRLMVQSLLAERFALKVHTKNRQVSAYTLRVSKRGLRMRSSAETCEGPGTIDMPCGSLRLYKRSQLFGKNVPLSELVEILSTLTGRAVIDKTSLQGTFDINLQWTPDENLAVGPEAGVQAVPNSQEGALFTALEEQLGLRLQSEKEAIPVTMIDSAQRPSSN